LRESINAKIAFVQKTKFQLVGNTDKFKNKSQQLFGISEQLHQMAKRGVDRRG
jgi:hypothetical protein